MVAGDDAFKLSDTFGFPIELTIELAADAGLQVDEDRFRTLLEEQKDARAGGGQEGGDRAGRRRGAADDVRRATSSPRRTAPIALLLERRERTARGRRGGPGGARVPGSHAVLRGGRRSGRRPRRDPHATGIVRVLDTQKAGRSRDRARRASSSRARSGPDRTRSRRSIACPREAHRARAHLDPRDPRDARSILGEHARQAGSLIEPGRLRFDFSHPSGVPIEVLEQAELEANRRLAQDDVVRIFETIDGRGAGPRRRPRCSARSTARSCGWSRSATTRGSSAAGRTSGAPERSR